MSEEIIIKDCLLIVLFHQ